MKQNSRRPLAKTLFFAPALCLLIMAGCQAGTVDVQPQEFANIRVMNFAPWPASSMDVYWWQYGENHPALPQSQNLRYGGGAVYTTGILASTSGTVYHYDVTPATHPEKHDIPGDPTMTIVGGKKYTLMITTVNGNFTTRLIPDRVVSGTFDSSKAYVRFINMQPGTPNLSMRVNDPSFGDVIDMVNGSHGVAFNANSDYVPLKTVLDTSFSFYVIQTGNATAGVLARLTDQTFTGGNFYTLIYAGDPARLPTDTATTDTAQAPLDNFRLRAFDDNNLGNDQTAPLQPAFRYNVVNGIVPPASGYYNGDTKLGFVINGETFTERDNFTFWPVPALTPAGSGFNMVDPTNSLWEVNFASTSIPSHKVGLSASATDDAGKNAHLLFDLNDNNKLGFDETKLSSDTSISFVFYNGDSTMKANPRYAAIGIPNYSYPDSIILVFVSAVGYPVGGTKPYTSFYTSISGLPDMSFLSKVPGMSNIVVIPAANNQITVTDSVGKVGAAVAGSSSTFTAAPGGIYEIVSVGSSTQAGSGSPYVPKLLVMHLNKTMP
ncbi:MAG: hypothetical protein Q8922_03415 [Bacteroidota bacterium]|nr:hypothetical protein [Bacteroidota bacterium]MDP4233339.1 hypothetical protein [Bacteroidota bacterium]MDP4242206.1 hypothetical protein [Bacteroidota bacterium]MDP4286962.1 hypothetical protein [Bacteroidota bacterium]